jgi:DNA-binding NarL/FixJ family response regulator
MSIQSKRVLLIEDNQGDVDLVRLRLLESNSELGDFYDVSSADRLSTGLAELNRERPAVVLLDLYLPDSKGAETFHNLISQAPGVPVVVLSARDDEDLVINAVKHGVQDYLVKGTFDGKKLGRTLRCAIERQALLTALDLNWKGQAQLMERSLGHVSDDLLAPLTEIQEAATALLDDITQPVAASHRKHLNTILRKATRLHSTIENLRAAHSQSEQMLSETPGPHLCGRSTDS